VSLSTRKPIPECIRSRGLFYPYDVWEEYLNAAETVPVKQPIVISNQPKYADPLRGLFEGLVIGAFLPCVTRPLDKLQVVVNTTPEKITWNATVTVMRNNPYKGLGFRMITNTVRNTTIFFTIPVAQNCLQKQGYSQDTSEKAAPAIAGALCGALMSPYTILDQRYQVSGNASWRDVYNKIPRVEFKKMLPVAFCFGVVIDMTFWSIYSKLIKDVEKQLCIVKQKDSLTKLWEELGVGALACMLTLPFSFPIHALQIRLINNSQLTIYKDFQAAQKYSVLDMLRKHYYRGFSTGLARMGIAMSVLNGLKYAANIIYDREFKANTRLETAKTHTFFKPSAPDLVACEANDSNSVLLKLGSN
jgi:hypothetical protein